MDTGPEERPLDFWSFVEVARQRLAEEPGAADVEATELLLSLNRASSLVTYDLESGIHRPEGRSWAAFRLMYVLWLAGKMEPHRLAEVAGMSRAAVSNLVRPLCEQGILVRESHPDDGRAVLLSLTPAGHAAARSAYLAQNVREAEWVSVLTPAERVKLVRLLGKLVDGRSDIDPQTRS